MLSLVFMPCCQHLSVDGEFRERQESVWAKNEALRSDECCANRSAINLGDGVAKGIEMG